MIKTSRPHWSYSALSQYMKCPLQYYFERVLKLPRKTISDAQVLGSSVHAALAEYHRKLQSGDSVQSDAIHSAYLAAWDEQASQDSIVATGNKSIEDSRGLGIALVDAYLNEPPPQNIVAVERPLMAPIANSRSEYLDKPVLVIVDLVTRQDVGTLRIEELKTSGRAYSESEVATSLQPTFYANALYEMTGDEPTVGYTVLVKTRVPKVQRIEAVRAASDYARLGDLLETVETAIDAGVFYPNESPMTCSGCSFFRPCREWTGNQDQRRATNAHSKEAISC